MPQKAHDAYLENRVLSANPLELVHLLYQAATSAVRDARRHLAAGEIGPRSRAIGKAGDILMEVTAALDHARGGEISHRLAQLYDYMGRRLLEANFRQTDEPLTEVLGLLTNLSEVWQAISQPSQPARSQANPWAAHPAPTGTPVSTAWSL
jgi:flagellar secretion chaperone FliS